MQGTTRCSCASSRPARPEQLMAQLVPPFRSATEWKTGDASQSARMPRKHTISNGTRTAGAPVRLVWPRQPPETSESHLSLGPLDVPSRAKRVPSAHEPRYCLTEAPAAVAITTGDARRFTFSVGVPPAALQSPSESHEWPLSRRKNAGEARIAGDTAADAGPLTSRASARQWPPSILPSPQRQLSSTAAAAPAAAAATVTASEAWRRPSWPGPPSLVASPWRPLSLSPPPLLSQPNGRGLGVA